MSQAALAKAINQRESVVTSYENGKAIPTSEMLNKIEKALGAKVRPNKHERAKQERAASTETSTETSTERIVQQPAERSWPLAPWVLSATNKSKPIDCRENLEKFPILTPLSHRCREMSRDVESPTQPGNLTRLNKVN